MKLSPVMELPESYRHVCGVKGSASTSNESCRKHQISSHGAIADMRHVIEKTTDQAANGIRCAHHRDAADQTVSDTRRRVIRRRVCLAFRKFVPIPTLNLYARTFQYSMRWLQSLPGMHVAADL
ncbi:hypothetical protein [Stenotrophomonas sp. PSU-St19]